MSDRPAAADPELERVYQRIADRAYVPPCKHGTRYGQWCPGCVSEHRRAEIVEMFANHRPTGRNPVPCKHGKSIHSDSRIGKCVSCRSAYDHWRYVKRRAKMLRQWRSLHGRLKSKGESNV